MFDDPCFTVYLKSNTIHVFKSAIRSIGTPNYVRLFIHEDGKTILMKSYDKKSQISIKVPRNLSTVKPIADFSAKRKQDCNSFDRFAILLFLCRIVTFPFWDRSLQRYLLRHRPQW